jgi:hypothetical protein
VQNAVAIRAASTRSQHQGGPIYSEPSQECRRGATVKPKYYVI